MAATKDNPFVEGGNEEYAGIAVGIIANVVQFAINNIEKIIPYPQTFQFELNLAIQIIILFIPVAGLLALIQGIRNRRKGSIVYFISFFLVGLLFVYAQLMNTNNPIEIINPVEFLIDTVVLIIILIIKYQDPTF